MTDKDQYTNNVNDEWCELDIDQWINTTVSPIISQVYAYIRYTTIDTYNYFITAGNKIYYTVKDIFSQYVTKNNLRR